MIRGILVALGSTKSSKTAMEFSIKMAKAFGAQITGIGILDQEWITTPEALPIGGAVFKAELDMQLLKESKAKVTRLISTFKKQCEEAKIKNWSTINTVGEPEGEIVKHLIDHDVLIAGKDANFHFMPSIGTSVPIHHLMHANPRPLILTGSGDFGDGDLLVAYDGTQAASKSLHMAILLGICNQRKVHITTVARDTTHAEELLKMAESLCLKHKIKPKLHPIVTDNKASKEIIALAEKLKVNMIIAGAYGHSGIQHLFIGSCADDLISGSSIPCFLYH